MPLVLLPCTTNLIHLICSLRQGPGAATEGSQSSQMTVDVAANRNCVFCDQSCNARDGKKDKKGLEKAKGLKKDKKGLKEAPSHVNESMHQ